MAADEAREVEANEWCNARLADFDDMQKLSDTIYNYLDL
jgi:hypothetical protein